ncbi:Zn-ribbon domain-containing OB-fold protein [Actinoallomurus sp. CA-150999]|uniref:Zn-ribbon domain-containing OB-fold protein n=1 Tax=Actinoallomurus sp. CA-150999 TaxID=3239887 RepID=UPI003D9030E1
MTNGIPAVRDERSAAFFDVLKEGTLLLRRCRPHGHLSAPEVLFCATCADPDLGWSAARGTGRVVSWTAIHSRPDPSGATTVNTIVGVVELDEGPWLLARLLAPDIRTGMTVRLEVVETGGEPIYAFRPAGDEA